ncbi:MAG: hypothetical protein K6E33_02070, partial [Lachnospiraceae bacterium]|nr:hypothetical protein [Lachnospiraceae bacterium]
MKRNIIKEIIIFLIPILIMAVVVAVVAVNLFPGIQDVFMDGGTYEEIMAYLDSIANVKGLLAIALLQIVQVFSIFIPAATIQIAAGIVYGFVLSFAVTFTSFVIANMIVYIIAKKRIGRLDELVFSSEGKVQKLFEW